MRVPAYIEATPPKLVLTWLQEFAQALYKAWNRLAVIINGQLSFGDGTNRDNIDGAWASVVSAAVPGDDFVVTHNLGRIPVGYLIMGSSALVSVCDGSVPATITELTLQCTGSAVTLKLFVI